MTIVVMLQKKKENKIWYIQIFPMYLDIIDARLVDG